MTDQQASESATDDNTAFAFEMLQARIMRLEADLANYRAGYDAEFLQRVRMQAKLRAMTRLARSCGANEKVIQKTLSLGDES